MVVVPAYAKVNLALEVVARRSDGYHDLISVVATIDWHDLVGVRLSDVSPRSPLLRLTGCAAEGVPDGAANLALAAAQRLGRTTENRRVIDVWLDKRLPTAAGLAGGSADAAAVLRAGAALLALDGERPDTATLTHMASSLGSDVPALLRGGCVLIRGRGDVVTPLTAPPLHLAIAVAGASSTAATYAALGDTDIGTDGRAEQLARALAAGERPAPALLGSRLEAAARRVSPQLGAALARLRASTPGDAWHLTGSGGAAFAIAVDADDARRLAARAADAGFVARACRTVG